MQIRKLTRKATALVMAAVTALSIILATTAFAATGDVGTISFNMTYDSNGNAMRYNSVRLSVAIPQAVKVIINAVCRWRYGLLYSARCSPKK